MATARSGRPSVCVCMMHYNATRNDHRHKGTGTVGAMMPLSSFVYNRHNTHMYQICIKAEAGPGRCCAVKVCPPALRLLHTAF
jgi:hypothetical protein